MLFYFILQFLATKIILKNKKEAEIDNSIFNIQLLKQKNILQEKSFWQKNRNCLKIEIDEEGFSILKDLCKKQCLVDFSISVHADTILKYCNEASINNFLKNLVKMINLEKQNKSFELIGIMAENGILEKFAFMFWDSLSLPEEDLCYESFFDPKRAKASKDNLNYFSLLNNSEKFFTLKLKKNILEKIKENEFLKKVLIFLEIRNLEICDEIPEKEFFDFENLVSLKIQRKENRLEEIILILGNKKSKIRNLILDLEKEEDLLLLKNFPNLEFFSLGCNLINVKEVKFDFPKNLLVLELLVSGTSFLTKERLKKMPKLKKLIYLTYLTSPERQKELFMGVRESSITTFYFHSKIPLSFEDVSLILENKSIVNLQIGEINSESEPKKINPSSVSSLGIVFQEMDDKKLEFIKNFEKLRNLFLIYSSSPFKQEKKIVNFHFLKNATLEELQIHLSPFYHYDFSFLKETFLKKLKIVNLNILSMTKENHELEIFDGNDESIRNLDEISLHRLSFTINKEKKRHFNFEKMEIMSCQPKNLSFLFSSLPKIKKIKISFTELTEKEVEILINIKCLIKLTLENVFVDERAFRKFIRSKFENGNIKFIRINQYGVSFSETEVKNFGENFVDAKIYLNNTYLTVSKRIVYEVKESEDVYDYL